MSAKVVWKDRMSFTATADSGFEIPLGTYPEIGGDNDGFRPMELFAIGLAGCTGMDVISILKKKRQDVTGFEVSVNTERSQEHPKVFTSATVDYFVEGHNIDERAVLRAMELSAERYCPAQAMLGQIMPIYLRYKIFESGDDNESTLVTSGELKLEDQPIT